MVSRRQFLKRAGLVSAAPVIPGFFTHSLAANAQPKDDNGRILVVIQMNGGNDGLNTVVPFAQDVYREKRPELALPENQLLKIDGAMALNGAMSPAAEMLDQGRLAVVQNVGYPNPDRSHFRSMAIWQTASNDDDLPENGWAGRALDTHLSGRTDAFFVGEEDLPLSLRGRRSVVTSMLAGKKLQLNAKIDPHSVIQKESRDASLDAFVRRNVLDAYTTVRELNQPQQAASSVVYPSSGLASRLQTIARFIGMESSARVYYTIQSGYDTHNRQLASHGELLGDFSGAVKAFMDEMKVMGLEDRVVLMAFSEFGRRVNENGSAGTDHGTAGPVFLAGSKVRSGLIGNAPDLSDLDGDDLKMQFDFRQVYASLLDDWLGIASESAIGGRFECLPLFA